MALEGQVFPYPSQAMQWESSAMPHGQQQQQQPPAHPQLQPTPSTSEPPLSSSSYSFSPTAHVMQQQQPSPSTSSNSHLSQGGFSPAIGGGNHPAASVPRSPTPPPVPVGYPGQYADGLSVNTGSAAGQNARVQDQTPNFADAHGVQGFGTDLDMLGMDGVTFWTPWMSTVGIDGNGNVDETAPNYNSFARPAGW